MAIGRVGNGCGAQRTTPHPYSARETEWARDGRHTGRTDIPLTELGRLQATVLGDRLRGRTFVRVLSSPLARAYETCRLAGVAEHAEISDDLMEWDYGEYEGRRTAEIRQEVPGWSIWRDGVPGGETAADVGARADRIIADALATDEETVLFAHGHYLRVLTVRWLGLPPETGRLFALAPATIGVLGYERGATRDDSLERSLPSRAAVVRVGGAG